MKRSDKLTWRMKFFFVLLTGLLGVSLSGVAYADWSFGIGTGIFKMHAEGDQGLHIAVLDLPVELEVDLDPDDIDDLMKSAFGLGGFATDGKWMIQFSGGVLELEDDPSRTIAGVGTVSSEFGFDVTGGELTVGYPVYHGDSVMVRVEGGARYTKHELEADVSVDGTRVLSREIDNDWTDVLVGISVGVPLGEKWMWTNRFNAGFGGSEGTYLGYTGITWQFLKHWSATLYGKYTAVDFENGDKGDADWYLYDVNEYGPGLSILVTW
jgi:hypothetical protein